MDPFDYHKVCQVAVTVSIVLTEKIAEHAVFILSGETMESYDETSEQRLDGSVNLALNVPITEYTNTTNIYLLAEVY